ncbi:hypothetical protein IV38_GL000547 [Lactobacillus selangorensis]|uniref:Exodeoxyribonuclease 7 small subunit n=1 Tax=Lactobacillus selangorensis TaxID=81857 RepID=A0A0R2FWK2_9LACO|nr:exodeoxyribonuclease VII small subunit [Lactobacillus selangorensis]KRN29660.1 hypothetical protein IV38_GL000547 [Lactobacillus selangorensis]KRN33811.1 hypothetical protein IV40_GL000121 [Lactobacillus selangorensis]
MMAEPTFEENLTQLEQIVDGLEKGDVPLEKALDQFQKGIALSKKLETTLTHAETTLTKVMADNGQEEPFETDADAKEDEDDD